MKRCWFVYILRCGDGTLYTGITTDIVRRVRQHGNGTGAKYTRGRGRPRIRYWETQPTKGKALSREYEIKQLDRTDKLKLRRT